MSKAVEASSGGISMASLLGILFVGLKLTGYIAWSWWWVTAPFWIPFLILFAIFLIILVLGQGTDNGK